MRSDADPIARAARNSDLPRVCAGVLSLPPPSFVRVADMRDGNPRGALPRWNFMSNRLHQQPPYISPFLRNSQ